MKWTMEWEKKQQNSTNEQTLLYLAKLNSFPSCIPIRLIPIQRVIVRAEKKKWILVLYY